MTAYFRLMRLDKPIGIYLLLYPTLWALFLAAGGLPDLKLFVPLPIDDILKALQSSCLPVYLYICLLILNKDYLLFTYFFFLSLTSF
jgi:hypothetical protein